MKKWIHKGLLLMVISFFCADVHAQVNAQKPFPSIKIGNQEWMTVNWDYKTPKSFFYNNDSTLDAKYGRLYYFSNALAAAHPGWHLPTLDEWYELIDTIGGLSKAGLKMFDPTYGLNLVAGGYKSAYINEGEILFGFLDTYAFYWTATPDVEQTAYAVHITKATGEFDITSFRRANGFSVRYVKNKE